MKLFIASILVGTASASGLRGQQTMSDLLAVRGRGQLQSASFASAVAAKANPNKVVEEIEEAIREAESPRFACSFLCPPGSRIVPGSLDSNGCNGRCEPIACTRDVRQCPGSDPFNPITVSRNPKLDCAFDPCPEPKPCKRDVKPCPGTATASNPFGVSVGRDPLNDCEFKKCPAPTPKPCMRDVKPCPGTATSANPLGVSVGRDPLNNCEFAECPRLTQHLEKVGDGFCRTRHNGKGKANFEPGNGNDYQTLPDVSLEECRDVCASETPASSSGEQGYICKGYEYVAKSRKCEIWYNEPAKAHRKHGAVCFKATYSTFK